MHQDYEAPRRDLMLQGGEEGHALGGGGGFRVGYARVASDVTADGGGVTHALGGGGATGVVYLQAPTPT
jgi:hypothetical protein